jgi:hypothetical protein
MYEPKLLKTNSGKVLYEHILSDYYLIEKSKETRFNRRSLIYFGFYFKLIQS